jgi:hypothetical protein
VSAAEKDTPAYSNSSKTRSYWTTLSLKFVRMGTVQACPTLQTTNRDA